LVVPPSEMTLPTPSSFLPGSESSSLSCSVVLLPGTELAGWRVV
jgi:hypothetical protein